MPGRHRREAQRLQRERNEALGAIAEIRGRGGGRGSTVSKGVALLAVALIAILAKSMSTGSIAMPAQGETMVVPTESEIVKLTNATAVINNGLRPYGISNARNRAKNEVNEVAKTLRKSVGKTRMGYGNYKPVPANLIMRNYSHLSDGSLLRLCQLVGGESCLQDIADLKRKFAAFLAVGDDVVEVAERAAKVEVREEMIAVQLREELAREKEQELKISQNMKALKNATKKMNMETELRRQQSRVANISSRLNGAERARSLGLQRMAGLVAAPVKALTGEATNAAANALEDLGNGLARGGERFTTRFFGRGYIYGFICILLLYIANLRTARGYVATHSAGQAVIRVNPNSPENRSLRARISSMNSTLISLVAAVFSKTMTMAQATARAAAAIRNTATSIRQQPGGAAAMAAAEAAVGNGNNQPPPMSPSAGRARIADLAAANNPRPVQGPATRPPNFVNNNNPRPPPPLVDYNSSNNEN